MNLRMPRLLSSLSFAAALTAVFSRFLCAAPGQVTGLSASIPADAQVQLTWTAPGAEAYTGNVTGGMWHIACSSNPTNPTADTAEYVIFRSTDYLQGRVHTIKLTSFQPFTTYYFWIKARNDQVDGWSVWSSSVAIVPSCYIVTSTYTGVMYSSLAWGDYDNDGDLDLALAGSFGGYITRIYRNTSSTFTDIGGSMTGVQDCCLTWGDYDNDGDLDLGMAGYSPSYIMRIYGNTNGVFADIGAGFTGLRYCSLGWGDYDNDGDLDLAAAGAYATYQYTTRIYSNTKGVFTDIGAGFTGVQRCSLTWGDYDNDGDLDLGIAGSYSAMITRIYRNTGGAFSDIGAGLTGVQMGSVAWCDYDNDGDLDIGISGNSSVNLTRIYRNTNGAFTDIGAGLPSLIYCSLAWGDYDNNGDPDLAIAGDSTSYITRIYRNTGGAFADIGAGLPGVRYCSLAWGDYDNDNDIDLALAGATTTEYLSRLIKFIEPDYYNIRNTAPSIPESLSSSYNADTGQVALRWGRANDPETLQGTGLYYEVRCATEPISENMKVWAVSPSTGMGATPFLGNYPHGYCVAATSQAGVNLYVPISENGTYYWQVRSIDPGFRRSAWSETQTCAVERTLGRIVDFRAEQDYQIRLLWSAPDNGSHQPCGSYLLKYSTSNNITNESEFSSALTYNQEWVPGMPGVSESKVLSGLPPGTMVWFSIKASTDTAWTAISSTGTNAAMTGIYYQINTGISGVASCSLAWGDYDNDGDLDLGVAGEAGPSNNIARIYRNTGGLFSDIGAGLAGVNTCSLAWGDYDNDGDLDLGMAGYGSTYLTRIYRNTGSTFTDIGAGLTGVRYCSLIWGDYDNDGDLDLGMAGYSPSYITRIYRNTGGTFTDIGAGLTGVRYCSLGWGDYDNDGDLDLAMAGAYGSSSYVTRICRNANGTFTDIGAGFTGINNCSLAWGDYDNDGDLDLGMAGIYAGAFTRIYRNTAGAFADIGAGLQALFNCSLAWGDYNNDGTLDLGMAGTYSSPMAFIYTNNNSVFSDIGACLTGVELCSLVWGDYDNDTDLDLAIAGYRGPEYLTKLIRFSEPEYYTIPNNAPTIPDSLSSTYDSRTSKVTLQWSYSSDPETTQQKGLYYEVRAATEPLNDALQKWYISPSTGIGATPLMGNYPHSYISAALPQAGLSFYAPLLTQCTVYWQVRSIDTGFMRSTWSAEQSCYVSRSLSPIVDLTAAVDCQVLLTWTAPDNGSGQACGGYEVKYSTSGDIIDEASYAAATTFAQNWAPAAAGMPESKILTGFAPRTGVWFSIKASSGTNWSAISSTGTNYTLAGICYDIAANVTGMYIGALAWGDYDNDGDLDLAAAGNPTLTRIYRNTNGILTDIGAGLTGVYYSAVGWGDYDNDGDLDLAVAGTTNGTTHRSRVYRNTGTSFTDTGAPLVAVNNAALAWGDYDNDGDIDLAISGTDGSARTRLYQNNAGTFTNSIAVFVDVYQGGLAWGDYDNDGDLDLMSAGYTGSAAVTRLYRNTLGVFSDVSAAVPNVYRAALAWGDYDNDGDLDLCLSGYTAATTKIYRNTSGVFTDIGAGLTGVYYSAVAWGDYDNDGDLDLAVAGTTNGSLHKSTVYKNTAAVFSDTGANLSGINYAALAWGDYDNDNDLDLAMAGVVLSNICRVIRFVEPEYNNTPNTAPAVPGSLSSTYDSRTSKMTFQWGYGSDAETAQNKGLYYEVRAATEPVNDALKKWYVSPSTGMGATPFLGNYPHGYISAALPQAGLSVYAPLFTACTVYWQVRSIDTGFRRSAWSAEQSCSISRSLTPVVDLAAVTDCQVKLSWTAPDNGEGRSCGSYLVKYSTMNDITDETSFADALTYAQAWVPVTPGMPESKLITGLPPRASIWFSIKSSSGMAWSSISSTGTNSAVSGICYDVGASLAGFSNGSLAWGDYDNDGDLDLAAAGLPASARIYRNTNCVFTDTGAGLTGVYNAALGWADFDNDGDLDLAIAGTTNGTVHKSILYRNTGGAFTDSGAGLTGVHSGALGWGDFDNDGDVDIAVTGTDGVARTRMYRNSDGIFTNTGAAVIDVYSSALAWGDYDNDGDLDLLVSGTTGGFRSANLYRNTQGAFTDLGFNWADIDQGAAVWVDHDNDGTLELSIAGYYYSGMVLIYEIIPTCYNSIWMTGLYNCAVAWGDYDNDGDLDEAVAGTRDGTNHQSRVYRNDGAVFTNIEAGLTGVVYSSLAWGDYDNDQDLDLAMAGATSSGNVARIIRFSDPEYAATPNTAPLPPAVCSSEYNPETLNVELRWGHGSDAETTVETGLYYEVRAATEPIVDDLAHWYVSPSTGAGATPFMGNYPHGYCVEGTTQPGVNLVAPLNASVTCYWQVRSIDTGLRKSAWSPVQSCLVTRSRTAINNLSAARDRQIRLSWTAPDNGEGLPCGSYLVKYSTVSDITDDSAFAAAITYAQSWSPASPGTLEDKILTGLPQGVLMWFSVKASSADAWSAISSTGSNSAIAGYYYPVTTGLPDMSYCSLALGDYDNDGDLDIALAGSASGTSITRVYRNAGSLFTYTGALMTGLSNAAVAWGDSDNDGDLDLVAAGLSSSLGRAAIYRNDNGTFTDAAAGLTGVYSCSAAWGDYNNDGDLDLVVAGSVLYGNTSKTRVYRNTNGLFTDINAGLSNITECSLEWGDYDNDGDLDLATVGSYAVYTDISCTRLYRNDSGVFSLIPAALPNVSRPVLSWGDYDNDGDLDLAMAGLVNDAHLAGIYRNDNGVFTDAGAGLTGVISGDLAWGDADTDGDLDLAVIGHAYPTWTRSTRLYRNDGAVFTDTNVQLTNISYGSVAWGDLYGAGDSYLALAGDRQDDTPLTTIVKMAVAANNVPAPPLTGFSSTYDAAAVRLLLRWDNGSDTETPVDGLCYSIRSSTTTPVTDNTANIIAWRPAAFSGGNYPHGYCDPATRQPGMNLAGLLANTTYYWQVRAVDTGQACSSWSAEQSVYVPPELQCIRDLRALTNLQVQLSWTAPDNGVGEACGSYLLKYSTVAAIDSESAFTAASTYAQDWIPAAPGMLETRIVSGFQPGITVWFSVKASSAADWSGISLPGAESAQAGYFVYASTTMAGMSNCSLAWGDYDNDGNLDFAAAGSYITKIYRNLNATFTDNGAGLPGFCFGSIGWADYDNDGDLDLGITGWCSGNRTTRVYRNTGGSFVDINGGFTGYCDSSLAWGDYDNDGDLDLAAGGGTTSGNGTGLYRNTGGSFTNVNQWIDGVYYGCMSWGDYDNDGDLDLATVSEGTPEGRIYRNSNGIFSFVIGLPDLSTGSVAWGDYDNDGDLDLALAGQNVGYMTRIYGNEGAVLTDIGAGLEGISRGGIAWGDCDNDGDLDLAVTGWTRTDTITQVYRNNAGNFTDMNAGLPGLCNGSFVAWGDFDHDGNVDIGMAGNAGSVSITRIARAVEPEYYGWVNTAPNPPVSGFRNEAAGNRAVLLAWDYGSDAETAAAAGLNYELRVATNPVESCDGLWIISPSTGAGAVAGNAYYLPSSAQRGYVFGPVTEGTTYYWQVRTIDTSFLKSAWSAEQSYPCVNPPDQATGCAAQVLSGTTVQLSWVAPGDDAGVGDVTGGRWRVAYTSAAVPAADTAAYTIEIATDYVQGATQLLLVTGLQPFVPWYFWIKARDENDNGWSVWSATVTCVPMGIPANLSCTEQSDDLLHLSWDAVDGATQYGVYRSTDSGGPWEVVAPAVTDTVYDDDADGGIPSLVSAVQGVAISSTVVHLSWDEYTGLLAGGTVWHYSVTAWGNGYESQAGATASGSVTPVMKGYGVYRDGAILATVLGDGTTAYTDTSLLPNTSGSYQLAAITTDDCAGPLSGTTVHWSLAAEPAIAAAMPQWNETDLYYTTITVDPCGNSPDTEYAVTIDSGGYGTWWLQANNLPGQTTFWSETPVWTHAALPAGTTIYYKVKARNHDGLETALSGEQSAYMSALPGPQHFRALTRTSAEIVWIWDDAASESAYQAYSATGTLLAARPQNVTSWTESGLTQNTEYARYVTLTHPLSGESLPSNTSACCTLMNDPAGISFTMIGSSSMTVRPSSLVTNISSGSSGAYFTNATRSEVSGWLHTDTWTNVNLIPNTRYSFMVRLRNADGVETLDSPVASRYTQADLPAAPVLYKVKDTNVQIILQEDSNPAGTEYAIKITTAAGGTAQYAQYAGTYAVRGAAPDYRAKSLWGERILLTGLAGSTTYYVCVNARNTAGTVTADSGVAYAVTLAYAPELVCGWDSTNGHHVHVIISTGTNPETMEYAILHTATAGLGLWLDGSGSVQPDPCYLTKEQWEILAHRNAHIDLDPGTQHRYRVQSRNPATGEIFDSAESAIYTLLDAPTAPSAQEVDDDYLRLFWSQVVNATQYTVYRSSATDGVFTAIGTSTGTVYADDVDGGAPHAVSGITGTVVSSTTVALAWNRVGNPVAGAPWYYVIAAGNATSGGVMSGTCGGLVSPIIAGYRIYRGSVLVTTVSSTTLAWQDASCLPSTQYIYQVAAVTSDGLESALTDPVTCITFPKDMPRPEDVIGLRVLSLNGTVLHARFSAVASRADGSDIGNCLKGYWVYCAETLHGPWTRLCFINPQDVREFSDTYSGALRYYCVTAIDVYNQESDKTMVVDTQTDIMILSLDGRVNMSFDNDSKAVFTDRSDDIRIKIQQGTNSSDLLMQYTITAYDDAGRLLDSSIIERFRLGPLLTFRFGAALEAQGRAASTENRKPALFWHNTVKWVKVNGDLDSGSSVLSLRTKIFGSYSVQYAVAPTQFGVASVEPKIFSPDESDPVISRIRFYIDNPGSSEITARIFNRKGQLIKANLPRELETVIYWDGRDVNGKIVPSGVYLYQIEAENKVINGTVVVAR